MQLDNLKTISQMAKEYPGIFSENKLRWIVRNRDRNGFGKAVVILAGKALFDISEFEKALDELAAEQSAA